jgi:hypothetical protein
MIALATAAGFVRSLSSAGSIVLGAYTLHPGAVLDALAAAARRGADVRVRLEGDPLDDAAGSLHRANARALAVLRAAGARAGLTAPGEPTLHMKAAVVDGVAWLDGRNWGGGGAEPIVRDSAAPDVAAIAAALAGRPGSGRRLATTKAGAQRLEAGVIERAGTGRLCVESESFGNGPIYAALLRRARAHLPTRLIVAGREAGERGDRLERAHLAHLAALGVAVRTGDPRRGDLDDKLAAGEREAWAGSANATYARGAAGAQRDWGLTTNASAACAGLRAAFEHNWARAEPLAGSGGVSGKTG